MRQGARWVGRKAVDQRPQDSGAEQIDGVGL